MDIVGPFPKTPRGNTHIVVAMEYLTKWPEARAIPNTKALSVVSFFYEDVICWHGCPKEILTDHGTHFINKMLDSLCTSIGTKHKLSTAYHPQTNGLVEWFNWTLCEALAKYANTEKDDWDLYIPSVLFAYQIKRHETTHHEPFYLIYGRDAILLIEFAISTRSIDLPLSTSTVEEDLLSRVHTITGTILLKWDETQDRIYKSQQKQKQQFDQTVKSLIQYKIGDLVLLYKSQLWGKQKLEERWTGPYYIYEILVNDTYKLRTQDDKVLKTPINAERLKPYMQW
jgi:hypothetical protein